MKAASEKAKKRLESKKRKISAFLQVAELNDSDKKQKILEGSEQIETESENNGKSTKQGPVLRGPLLTGDSYIELRERLKARKKLLMQRPDFELKTVGHNADVDMHESFRTPLFIRDLQHLLLYALMGTKAPVEPSRWCKFTQWNKLNGVNCLVIEGAGLKDFHEHRVAKFSELSKFLTFKLEFLSPAAYNSRICQDFAFLPISRQQRDKLKEKFGTIHSAIEQGSAYRVLRSVFPTSSQGPVTDESTCLRLQLLLSVTQMIEEGYPIPLEGMLKEKYKTFVMTKSEYAEVTNKSPLFSIDCEMCLTSAGSELTKICVVNSNLDVVYMSFVKPKNRITNYLTRFSGITESMLEGVTTTIEDVQKAIIEILPPDAILVGQSLNCDLIAMQMMHPYIIDTSVIYCLTGDRKRKSKLSVLSKMFLGQEIQQDKGGHDPLEDAIAAMKLVLLKLEKGLNFGDVLLDGTVNVQEEGVKEFSKEVLSSTIFNHAKDNNQSVCIVAEKSILKEYKKVSSGAEAEPKDGTVEGKECASSSDGETDSSVKGVVFVKTSSSKESIEKSRGVTVCHNLTICHVNVLNEDTETDKPIVGGDQSSKLDKKAVKHIKKWTEKMWRHTPENGLFVTVWPGNRNQNAFVGIAINKANIVMP